MVDIAKTNEDFYRNTLEQTRSQIISIDQQVKDEVKAFKERMASLHNQRKVIKQIYDGAATLLGEPDEFAESGEEVEEI